MSEDFSLFGEPVSEEGKQAATEWLLGIVRANPLPTMGDFGGAPPDAPAFVVEIQGVPQPADYDSGLKLAAKELGMEFYEPTPVQRAGGELHYEVWYAVNGEALQLCSEPSVEAAAQRTQDLLAGMVGTMVMPIHEWAEAQKIFDALNRPKRRKPARGYALQGEFKGRWIAAGVYVFELQNPPEGKTLRASQVLATISEPSGLKRLNAKGQKPIFELRCIQLEGEWFANCHDLFDAALAGVFLENVRCWPDFAANQFVVRREFIRYMRTRGWRLPWMDESTTGALKAHGHLWLRDTPLLR